MPTPTWPATLNPSSVEWRLVSNTSRFVSPFNGAVETQERPGARWQVTLGYDQWRREDIAEYEAFLVALRGSAGRFYLWNHARETIRGYLGAPQFKSLDQGTGQLVTGNWPANRSGVLLKGDMIGVGGELKMVVEDANSDGGGTAWVQAEPPLRTTPPLDTPIVITKAAGLFMLLDDDQAGFSYQGPLGGFSIQVMEAF